ncbi:MAG TPA: L-threonylcarbamoyladenylate synthase [Stellaceae bacterium]|nr:L-threonylcarbamoyladenylate synthase [Stellaceae bacterium]
MSPDANEIEHAAELLRAGRLVAFPTETVYGLGGDATNGAAVAAIFRAKQRPVFNPLIVHLPDAGMVEDLVTLDQRASRVAARFWPGPLTLVLMRRAACPISLLASAGLDSLAIRVPAHPVAQALLRAAGRPIVAPSANRSGRISPTLAQHVRDELGDRVDLVLDGGACAIGLESTVLDLTEERPRLLRPGGLPAEALEAMLGPLAPPPAPAAEGEALPAPGMMSSHYAPTLPVRLAAVRPEQGEAFLAFGAVPPGIRSEANLSPSGDLAEAAAHLFSMLRDLDRPVFSGIAVMPIPMNGLGAAINDRLKRAAAPR